MNDNKNMDSTIAGSMNAHSQLIISWEGKIYWLKTITLISTKILTDTSNSFNIS